MKQTFKLILEIDAAPVRIERIGDALRVMQGDYVLALIQIDKGQGAAVQIEGFQTFKPSRMEGGERNATR